MEESAVALDVPCPLLQTENVFSVPSWKQSHVAMCSQDINNSYVVQKGFLAPCPLIEFTAILLISFKCHFQICVADIVQIG